MPEGLKDRIKNITNPDEVGISIIIFSSLVNHKIVINEYKIFCFKCIFCVQILI